MDGRVGVEVGFEDRVRSEKSERNESERRLSFERAAEFAWDGALYDVDVRKSYPERGFIELGVIGVRVSFVCFANVEGGVRLLSFRKANSGEVRPFDERAPDR
ncbi:MAG: BrnT family toxin [Rhizobiaceae bacterium]|nr:BrnT family toxin [Rhizobiaceae bacterium]